MRAQRQDHVAKPSAPVVLDGWSATRRGEPRLEELMEDPMMDLIWRRDGIEPGRARETLRKLRAIVRAGQEAMVKA